MKKHTQVDYGAAKLKEVDKGLLERLADNCLMKLEPIGKGPRVLQKLYKSELDKLYQKEQLCPWNKDKNLVLFAAGQKLAVFHSIGQGNPNVTSTINDIVNSMGHHDNRMLYLHFKDLYLKALQSCRNNAKEVRRVVLDDEKVVNLSRLQEGLQDLDDFWNPKRSK